jgi:aminoacrylate hydrolase
METMKVNGVEIAFEQAGDGPPVLLLAGLGGVGRGWGEHIDRYAARYRTIVPDHRGTGGSSKPADGYTVEALATDMAELVRAIGCGPVHVVGSSTGGAFAQLMALDHTEVVRSMTLVSSWAGPDIFFRRQFAVRKLVLEAAGPTAYAEVSALFLFAPSVAAARPEVVQGWVDSATAKPADPDIMGKRIDMIVAHDQRDRLHQIDVPTLVLVGDEDICTPPHASRELASLIPGAELAVVAGGHLIYKEQPDLFFETVTEFLDRH